MKYIKPKPVHVSEETWKWLKMEAARLGTPVKVLLEEYIIKQCRQKQK